MQKSFIVLSLIASLGIGGILEDATQVKAAETEYTSPKIQSTNTEINALKIKLEKASQELGQLNSSINDTQKEIDQRNQEITATKEKIEKLQIEINDILLRIEARNEILKDRARSLQESGGPINYLEVLLGAQSFGDFINRTEAVAVIVQADLDILKDHQNDKEKVEKAKVELNTQLQSLETMRSELKRKEDDLFAKQQEQEDKEKAIQTEINQLEKEKNAMIIQLKNKTIENNNQKNSKDTEIIQKQAVDSSQDIKVEKSKGNGLFIWPTIGGVVTSYQGPRWGKFHKGIDIAGPSDYTIIAASGGSVSYAGWMNGYGKTVKIEHNNGYSTRYSHLDSLGVSVGQSVSQGSKIGIMGNTGRSTGVHLDFEVYQNGKLLNPMSVLPRR